MAGDPAHPGSPQEPNSQSEPADQSEQSSPPSPNFFNFLVLGTACAACVIAAGGLGYALDSWLDTLPWLTFAGLAFGIVSAVMLAVARLRPYL